MKVSFTLLTCALFLILTLTFIQPVYGEYIYNKHEIMKLFGWIAVFIGILANLPFILYVKVKKFSIRKIGASDTITRDMLIVHKPVLNYHMSLNLIAFSIAIIHSLGFINRVDPVSISLAIVIFILTLSGLLLRFLKFRNLQIFTKIIHTQIIMSILLIALILTHLLF